jgi:Bacteriophage Mu Gam like protein.
MSEYMDALLKAGTTRQFKVTNDSLAMWCVKKIQEAKKELEMWREHYANQLEKQQEICDGTVSTMERYLAEYFETVPKKATATKSSYAMPNGVKLVLKIQHPKYEGTASGEFLRYLKDNGKTDMVKTTVSEKPDWDAFKKQVKMTGGQVVDTETGEVVPGIVVVEHPPVFSVEMGGIEPDED